MLRLAELGVKVFRSNSGTAFRDGRAVKALPKGFPDLIGWIPGRVAVFVAVEVKTKNVRLSEQQKNFKSVFEKDGGCYILLNENNKNDVFDKLKDVVEKFTVR